MPQQPVTKENGKTFLKERNESNGLWICHPGLKSLEFKALTPISCSNKGIYAVKDWELFKMPVSIIAVL